MQEELEAKERHTDRVPAFYAFRPGHLPGFPRVSRSGEYDEFQQGDDDLEAAHDKKHDKRGFSYKCRPDR
jgi:hypothetical protein